MKRTAMTMFLALMAITSTAQDDAGTESAFSFGIGARDLALGGSFLARPSDLSAIFWNPSALSDVSRSGLTGSHTQLFESGMSYQNFGGVLPTTRIGTFALGVSRIGINDIEARDINNQILGQFDDSRMSYRIGYGKSFSNTSIGASVHLEHHSIYDYSSTTSPGFDLAVSRSFSTSMTALPQFSFAMVGRNILRPSQTIVDEKVSFPTSVETGTTLNLKPWERNDITAALSLAAIKVSGLDPTYRTGLEITLASHLAMRGGYRNGDLSVGVGLQWSGISFDYALLGQDLDALHLLSLSIAIGPSKEERIQRKQYLQAQQSGMIIESRLVAKQQRTIDSLLSVADSAYNSNNLQVVENCLDRALFLTTVAGNDTTQIAERRQLILTNIANRQRIDRLTALEDSTRISVVNRDWQSVNYYAGIILADSAQHKEALTWKSLAESEIAKLTSREQLIKTTLLKADSLLQAGRTSAAYVTALKAQTLDPENVQLNGLIKGIQERLLREKAEEALVAKSWQLVQVYLDSAKVLYAGQEWIVSLSNQLAIAKTSAQKTIASLKSSPPKIIDETVRQQAEKHYAEAAKLFSEGDLQQSILHWENAETIAPNFKDVRNRLFVAYKFLGIEAYGKNNLESAISAWQSALAFAPDNKEVTNYLSRAETELSRRREIRSELQ